VPKQKAEHLHGISQKRQASAKQERRELFERLVGDGTVTIRFVCPRCSGPHALADCTVPEDLKHARHPEPAEDQRDYCAWLEQRARANGNGHR
jgi:hypothetical protein